jgi:hypothetical protein
MPYRHWHALVTVDRTEHRLGPYASRQTAERKAHERFKGTSTDELSVVYEVNPTDPHARRY